ncbi:MAG TPA: DUF3168 domain-containing protein [Candidatus Anammoximicrobium sp.]|nr:DUF3168 domain-containing protein [Candidatus Anammoximicrobium sp.]
MKSLLKAVYSRLTGSSVAQLAPGGIHWGLAPANASMPYIVLRAVPAIAPEVDTGVEAVEQRGVRVSAFATGMATAASLLEAVEQLFVGQPLSLDTGRCMAAEKSADDLQLDPDRAEDGEEVWQGILDLAFMVQRQPGQ